MRTAKSNPSAGFEGDLQSWELDYLRSGREPGPGDLWEFYLYYESGDWRSRWEHVRDRIIGEWMRRPMNERPEEWIRYLVRFGYISASSGSLLLGGSPPGENLVEAVGFPPKGTRKRTQTHR